MLDIIPQGFPMLLPATLQILGVVRSHLHAMKVFVEYLLEILPTID
jgi:hypothetical protein